MRVPNPLAHNWAHKLLSGTKDYLRDFFCPSSHQCKGGVLSPTGALVPIRKLFAICNVRGLSSVQVGRGWTRRGWTCLGWTPSCSVVLCGPLCIAGFVAWALLCLGAWLCSWPTGLLTPAAYDSTVPWARHLGGVSDMLRNNYCKAPNLSKRCTWLTALRRGGTWRLSSLNGNPQLCPLADLPPRIATDTVPMLGTAAARRPQGTKGTKGGVSTIIGHLDIW